MITKPKKAIQIKTKFRKNHTGYQHDSSLNRGGVSNYVYAFHKKYGYGVRALVEAQISRIKRCIGSSLKTQRTESQKREGIIIGNIINKWNSFGKCVCVKAG